MDNLPDDVLSNIFIRLKAKQIAQMRCISKSWNALFSQSSFIKSHLDRSVHNNDGVLLIFPTCYPFVPKHFTTHLSRSPHLELPNFIKLPANPQFENGRGRVIGSVNGLICFEYGSNRDSIFIYIWNPSLSAVLTLPPQSVSSRFYGWSTYKFFRFGFDPQTDDYKVVKLTQREKGTNPFVKEWLQVEVYSMRKGYWELITQKIPSHIIWVDNHDHICVDGHNGHLHWVGNTGFGTNHQYMIMAFNLGAETFCEMPFPDSIRHDKAISIHLGVFGGKLCVMSKASGGECEVWVMDEHGMAESWVKHGTFPSFIGDLDIFGFTSHNEFLFRGYPH